MSRTVDEISTLKSQAMRIFYATNAVGSTLFFMAIGLIILLQRRLGIEPKVVSGFVVVLLYVRGPIEQLANALPAFSQARVSFHRIAELSAQFRSREPYLVIEPAAQNTSSPSPADSFDEITLRQASYTFPAAGDVPAFGLGPIDLTIKHGETIFIVGENGSGKTTLIKLLLGLYGPTAGDICVHGESIGPSQRDAYRQLFSAIFSDYYLFDDLVVQDPALLESARRYLAELEIGHKVKIEAGAFSTIDLSAGQRKRLALIHALLEKRPVMIFDEWAADQDPTFRRIFYTEFLPDLKRQGKTLIVISHDDRYFNEADRVIRLQDGEIVQM